MTDDEQVPTCRNCDHPRKHNLWGRCSEEGCECRSYDPSDEATVVVLRHPDTMRPVAVPDEVVRESDRVYDAYARHRSGESWEAIAHTGGWPSPRAVAEEVRRYLDEGRAIFRGLKGRELMAREVDTLNALQAAFWPAAMSGKAAAGQMVLACVKARIEAYGKIPEDPEEVTANDGGPRTLIIDAGDYEAQLRRVGQQ